MASFGQFIRSTIAAAALATTATPSPASAQQRAPDICKKDAAGQPLERHARFICLFQSKTAADVVFENRNAMKLTEDQFDVLTENAVSTGKVGPVKAGVITGPGTVPHDQLQEGIVTLPSTGEQIIVQFRGASNRTVNGDENGGRRHRQPVAIKFPAANH